MRPWPIRKATLNTGPWCGELRFEKNSETNKVEIATQSNHIYYTKFKSGGLTSSRTAWGQGEGTLLFEVYGIRSR